MFVESIGTVNAWGRRAWPRSGSADRPASSPPTRRRVAPPMNTGVEPDHGTGSARVNRTGLELVAAVTVKRGIRRVRSSIRVCLHPQPVGIVPIRLSRAAPTAASGSARCADAASSRAGVQPATSDHAQQNARCGSSFSSSNGGALTRPSRRGRVQISVDASALACLVESLEPAASVAIEHQLAHRAGRSARSGGRCRPSRARR